MKSKKLLRILLIIGLVIFIVGLDQIAKGIVRQNVEYNSHTSVIGKYVILTKVENTGAFLGMGNSIPRGLYRILMIILPLAFIVYAFYYLFKKKYLSYFLTLGLVFFIGGGLGNIIDRILYGSVTDFLFFDFVLFHTGIVNLADIFVTFGFILMLLGAYAEQKNSKVKVAEQKSEIPLKD